jgi:hypothetical protein
MDKETARIEAFSDGVFAIAKCVVGPPNMSEQPVMVDPHNADKREADHKSHVGGHTIVSDGVATVRQTLGWGRRD